MNAAKVIMESQSIKDVTFSNIAKLTKLSRPSIYQYYKYPEEILANLLMLELNNFNHVIEKSTVQSSSELTSLFTQQILKRDLMMQLLAINFSIIKENVRDEIFLQLRTVVDDFKSIVEQQAHAIDPQVTDETIIMIQYSLLTIMASIYPLSNDDGYHAALVQQHQPDDVKPSYEALLNHELRVVFGEL